MRIIIDNHIPHINGLIEPRAEVLYLEPSAITREAVKDADALIIRTRTRCDAALLDGSRVRFIGSIAPPTALPCATPQDATLPL